MSITRDKYGIIIQQNFKDPTNEFLFDGADSISRTGIMAMCGSEKDIHNMARYYFKKNGEIVRHPYQPFQNQYKEMSRDQVVCAVAGMTPEQAEPVRKRHWLFVNKDFLEPSVKLHLAICANHWSKYLWAIPGYPWLILSILWACYVVPKIAAFKKRPDHELNQLLCICVKAGKPMLNMLCSLHPNWLINVNEYWYEGHGFWRSQEEIANTFSRFISGKLR